MAALFIAPTRSSCDADLLQRGHDFCAARFHQLAGHAPDHGGLFGLGDGAPAFGAQLGHGGGAVIAHAGHQDADKPLRPEPLHGGRDQAVDARMPAVFWQWRRCRDVGLAVARNDNDVGVALADVDVPRGQRTRRRRLPDTVNAQRRLSRLASGPVNDAGMC